MEKIKLVDVDAKRRSGRKRTAWIASVLLAGSLALSGCAAVDSAASAATTATSATSSTAATAESVAADASTGTTAQTIADTTAAAEAFRELIFPFMGILTVKSQVSATKRLMPLPSLPMTMAAGPFKSASYRDVFPFISAPKIHTPRFCSSFISDMFSTSAHCHLNN